MSLALKCYDVLTMPAFPVDVSHVIVGALRWTERRERRTRRTRQASEFSLLVYLEAPSGPRCCNTPMKLFHRIWSHHINNCTFLNMRSSSLAACVHYIDDIKDDRNSQFNVTEKFQFHTSFFLSGGKTGQRW